MFLFHNNDRMKIKEYKYTIELWFAIPDEWYEEEFYRWLELILEQYGKLELIDEDDEYHTMNKDYILKSDKIVEIDCDNLTRYTVNWMRIREVRMVENSDKFVEVKFPSYEKVF